MKRKRILTLMLILVAVLVLLSVSITLAGSPEEAELSAFKKADAEDCCQDEVSQPDDAGGPDAFGYTYIDSNEAGGPAYSWVDISATGTDAVFSSSDDARDGPFSLGFTFSFYGADFSDVWLNTDGFMTVGAVDPGSNDFSNDCPLPSTNGVENLIAVVWEDYHLSPSGQPTGTVKYEAFGAGSCPYGGYGGACFVAAWDTYQRDFTITDTIAFEAILFDDNDIVVQVQDASSEEGSGSTTGVENADASIGLTYSSCNTLGHITDSLAVQFIYPPDAPNLFNSYKSGQDYVVGSEPITYTIVLSNSGVLPATNTLLTDTIPVGATYVASSLSCAGGTGACGYDVPGDYVFWTGDIPAGESVDISFAVVPSLSCGGNIDNHANVTADGIVSPLDLSHSTLIWDNAVYFTDFEADDGGFVPDMSGGEWEWGVPTFPAGITAYSGVNVWGTDLDSDASDSVGNHTLTKTLSLPVYGMAELIWFDFYGDEAADERQVYVNGNLEWDDSGGTDQLFWAQQSVTLDPAYSGLTTDIVYNLEVCCGEPGPEGWYIDDVAILSCDPPVVALLFEKTVSADGSCGISDNISVVSGTGVTYCYRTTNIGATDLITHTLVDSELGTLFAGLVNPLAPGEAVTVTTSAVVVTQTVVNTADWTAWASNALSVTVSDSATVNVLAPVTDIELEKTVSSDGTCGASDSISVVSGTGVTYCYRATNVGTTDLITHTLLDSELGTLFAGLVNPLAPGDVVTVTTSPIVITQTVVNTATWTAWTSDAMSDTAVSNATVFVMAPVPDIEVDPTTLYEKLTPDMMATQPLTISNAGGADLLWDLYEETTIVPAAPAVRPPVEAPVVSSPAECALYANYAGAEPAGYAEHCAAPAPAPWVSPLLDPTNTAFAQDIGFVSDNFVSHALNDFPGQTAIGPNARAIFAMDFDATGTTLYAIDNDTLELGTYNLSTGAFTPIATVTGVVAGDTTTGLAIDPATGVAYLSSVGTVMNLYTLNLTSGVATPIGSDATVVLLIDIAMGPQGVLYGHDISTDSIYTINTTTAAATLVGPTGVDSNFAQGMDFDNADGTLYAYTYQGGGANTYGTIDLATGALTPLAVSNPQGEFEGATQTVAAAGCADESLPWVSVVPNSGVTGPGGSQVVDVTFDATGLAAGTYTGTLCIESNDPVDPVVRVPVTLEVNAPLAALVMTKTVGLDPAVCATTDPIDVTAGSDVYYCYTVENTGTTTLTYHTVVDDQLGTLLGPDFVASISPGTRAWFTATANIAVTTVNSATWTVRDDQGGNVIAQDSDTATVNVVNPSIILTKTVGIDPVNCGTKDVINVQTGTTVYYCYTVTNNGDVMLPLHDLDDDLEGMILNDFPFNLNPGQTVNSVAAGVEVSATVNVNTTNVGTWTAFVDGNVMATDSASATVEVVPTDVTLTGLEGGSAPSSPVTLAVIGLLALLGFAFWRRRTA